MRFESAARTVRSVLTLAGLASAALTQSAAGQQNASVLGQGGKIISGSAAIASSHDQTTGTSSTIVNVSPTLLYFVAPHLAVGGTAVLGYSSSGAASSNSYGIGPSARYFFGGDAGNVLPFVSGSVFPTWGTTHSTSSSSSSDIDISNLALDTSVGLTQILGGGVGLTGEAYYTHRRTTQDIGSSSTSRSSYDVGLRFGITAFLH